MIESGDGKRTGQMEAVLRFGHSGLVKGGWVQGSKGKSWKAGARRRRQQTRLVVDAKWVMKQMKQMKRARWFTYSASPCRS
jgi:hypothetical protein